MFFWLGKLNSKFTPEKMDGTGRRSAFPLGKVRFQALCLGRVAGG